MDEGVAFDEGRWLVEHRREMDRAEAIWLERLARFDLDGLWALDGQLSCVSWLVWKMNMARSTAFEKVRVAHELRRRPVVAEAFGERIRRNGDGTGQVTVTLDDLEIEEFTATFQAFVDLRYRAVDESSAGDCEQTRGSKRADAFMDLLRTALAHADGGRAAGDDRYMVHLVRREGHDGATLLDGSPLDAAAGSMVCCDTSSVAHTISESGEPLNLGRKTREWSTAQRRAISVRDGGCCRFVGCGFAFDDIHHIKWWENGGSTDIDNGMGECRRHHRLLHSGFSVTGDPNDELRFYRPDGSYIGSTYPAAMPVS